MNSEPPPIHQCFRPAFCGMVSIVLQPTLFTVIFLIPKYIIKIQLYIQCQIFSRVAKTGEQEKILMNEHILHDMTLVNQQFHLRNNRVFPFAN